MTKTSSKVGPAPQQYDPFELSVVIPCLNEADTLGLCLEVAQRALLDHRIKGEIVVADNGSTDGSQEIAKRSGARVVYIPERGYGSALMGGIAAARGRYVVMGDADGSYDFGEIPKFLAKLREGFDLVLGCRLPSGGGRIVDGAMPLLHRWIGNPLFSGLARHWFRAPIHDANCGLRGFSISHYRRLEQRCVGMEFATEMIVKSSLGGARITEIPITLHPDGRLSHAPHLRTFRDGWRTLRFFLLFSPRWLFLVPGVVIILLGLAGYAVAMPGIRFGQIAFDVHTLLFASLAIISGYQSIVFAVFTKVFAISERLLPTDRRMDRLFELVDLEKGLLVGGFAMISGIALLIVAIVQWSRASFGPLDYRETMRWVIPGVTLTTLGFQTVLSSFFLSVLGLKRR
ncbi:MAG: glycosyltransferase family 2 protein [Acidobacteriota bacterium]|nr:glycosyltransferase family 2 protein [Acidobacteriota bacterium]MDQ5871483.1 glycosyltransferase family 2 protein [Acidobacteriota bacterium]